MCLPKHYDKTTEFIGLQVIVTSSAQHTAYIIHKLCSLCFSIRALTPIIKTGNLNPLTSSLFHHIVWSNSVGKLKMLKVISYSKIIWIMTVVKQKGTCWQIFSSTCQQVVTFSIIIYCGQYEKIYSKFSYIQGLQDIR